MHTNSRKPIDILFALSLITLLFSCKKKCDEVAVGKYYNRYLDDVVHYVSLRKDLSYLHYYKDADGVEKSHSGTWQFDRIDCEVMLENWTSYGDYSISCNDCTLFVNLWDGELVFSYDTKRQSNFFREKD